MRKLLFVCTLASLTALAAACSSDDSVTEVGPDPQNCTNGSIAVGDTKSGDVSSSSCATYDWYWWEDSVRFESYNVTVEKGKGYMFTLSGDDIADRSLGLVSANNFTGDSSTFYVAVQDADDSEGGAPAQLFFVAPQSGTYSLRAFGSDIDDSFDYTLTSRECTPRQIDITGAFTDTAATLTQDDCTIAEPYFGWANRDGVWSTAPTHVALYTVHFDGIARREITVTSDDFAPAFMIEGPGFDALCNTYYCDGNTYENQSFADSVSTSAWMYFPGTYTLTIGSMDANATGKFKVTISEPQGSDALNMRVPPSWGTLQPGQWKKMTGPR